MGLADAGRVVAVINADDFGISPQVTADIAACFEAGRITSTTILANVPGFEDACALAKQHGFADRVGVHLNLTFGPPLSEAMRRYREATGSKGVPPKRLFAAPSVLEAVEGEVRAQLLRVVREGIQPTHIDSHEHIINGFPYARIALRIAREFGIVRVRLARNAYYRRTPLKWLFKTSYNRYLRLAGARTVRYFADVKPYFMHIRAGGGHLRGPVELMCHPGARLREPIAGSTRETQLLLSPEFGEFLQGVRLITYPDV
jgi:predicted glycoside hydrolase/deacetylase ChbG (UPF0249 family)